MERTMKSIFEAHFESYTQGRRVPPHHYRAAWNVMLCRTSALGGHVQRCENGHVTGVWYNSCHHRWCPQCNGLANERWLERQRSRLLPVAHRHVVFTIPSEFRVLWLLNGTKLSDALFAAVSDTMRMLCRDERHVGGEPGYLLAQHTWGRSLSFHPHIHCLVSEGGLSPGGNWREPRRRSFLPARVVMMVFRGKYLARLRELLEGGELRLPNGESERTLRNELNRLGRVKWNVRVGERYGHGVGVATYLARYVRGGPLRNRQIQKVTAERVEFGYRSHRNTDGTSRQCRERVSPQELMRRWLSHVPEPGRQTVRWYGLYANRGAAKRARVREVLGEAPESQVEDVLDWRAYLERIGVPVTALSCPTCGARINQGEPMARSRGPPKAERAQGPGEAA